EACAALTRVLAPRSRYDEVVERYCEVVAAYPVGDPLDPAMSIAPLISAAQRGGVEAAIAGGRDSGAKVVLGGGRPTHVDSERGSDVEATGFRDVDNVITLHRAHN